MITAISAQDGGKFTECLYITLCLLNMCLAGSWLNISLKPGRWVSVTNVSVEIYDIDLNIYTYLSVLVGVSYACNSCKLEARYVKSLFSIKIHLLFIFSGRVYKSTTWYNQWTFDGYFTFKVPENWVPLEVPCFTSGVPLSVQLEYYCRYSPTRYQVLQLVKKGYFYFSTFSGKRCYFYW